MPDDRLPKPDERLPKPDDRHRAFRSALTCASPHAPLPHMADLTDLRWGPYPPTFPPRHQTALTGTRTATTAAVPTAACPIGPLGPRSRAQVRTHAARSTHAREVVVVVLAVPPLPSRCASWRAVRVTSVYLKAAHAPRAAGASSRQPHRARARRRASADVPAVVADVGSCALTCALRTRELHRRCARLPRGTRGDA